MGSGQRITSRTMAGVNKVPMVRWRHPRKVSLLKRLTRGTTPCCLTRSSLQSRSTTPIREMRWSRTGTSRGNWSSANSRCSRTLSWTLSSGVLRTPITLMAQATTQAPRWAMRCKASSKELVLATHLYKSVPHLVRLMTFLILHPGLVTRPTMLTQCHHSLPTLRC